MWAQKKTEQTSKKKKSLVYTEKAHYLRLLGGGKIKYGLTAELCGLVDNANMMTVSGYVERRLFFRSAEAFETRESECLNRNKNGKEINDTYLPIYVDIGVIFLAVGLNLPGRQAILMGVRWIRPEWT